MSLLEFIEDFLREFYWEIILAIIVGIIVSVGLFWRKKIRTWRFSRRITPKLDKALSVYEKEIIPEYVTTKPKMKIVQKKEEIPPDLPFGYIFVPEGQEELIWHTLIAYLPVSSSLRRIRILFDKDLRESLFDVLSYQLGLKLGKEEVAVKFRDIALERHEEDFGVMERIYSDGKLTYIILSEASLRFRRTKGKISVSDVKEFSRLVRKIAQIDAVVVRVGEKKKSRYVDKIIQTGRGAVLLARGKYICKAVDISNQLVGENYELYNLEELGFSNPEIGTWYFETTKNEVSLMRIWLKKKS